ncbi:beta-lactamase family protein [Pedobacter sp. PAMC26386]|nr:beta-lactamase family protein [Pedobacter sp. PAMC26386]
MTPCYAQIKVSGGKSFTAAALDHFLTKQIDSIGIPGLSIAIINDGRIVYHRTLGVSNLSTAAPLNSKSIFEAASLSKTVFTYFVLRLADKGVLNLDTPLYKYMAYPDIAHDKRYQLITARMVLSHTSGFPNWRRDNLLDTTQHIKPGNLYLKFTPGTKFSYSGEGYYYLAQVIAHLTKNDLQSLDQLFQKEVSIPLGLPYAWFSTHSFITKHKVTGYMNGKAIQRWPGSIPKQDSTWFGAAGGLHTEADSYAQFLIKLMNGTGLSDQMANEIFKEQVTFPREEDHDGESGWGLGIAILPTPKGTDYEHSGNNGNFQSYFRINKQQKNGYVFFTNCDQAPLFNEKLAHYFSTGT